MDEYKETSKVEKIRQLMFKQKLCNIDALNRSPSADVVGDAEVAWV